MLIRRERLPEEASFPHIPGSVDVTSAHVLAPAKINLYLEVLGRRPDGFHAIDTVMLAVDLFDELSVLPTADGDIRLVCDDPALSVGPDNLVIKAAALLRQTTGATSGATMRLMKRIPWAAGLGGGSSDAAAALAGLNDAWRTGLRDVELAVLGAQLGSDVPYFLATPAARCTGRGEVVEPVPVGAAFDIVLAKPPMGLNTAEVYKRHAAIAAAEPYTPGDPAELLRALAAGDIEQLGRSLHNRLQRPAMELAPPVEALYRRLQQSGAAGHLMTGSGSCLFALCRDEREAMQVAHDLLSGWPPEDELARTRVFHVRSCR